MKPIAIFPAVIAALVTLSFFVHSPWQNISIGILISIVIYWTAVYVLLSITKIATKIATKWRMLLSLVITVIITLSAFVVMQARYRDPAGLYVFIPGFALTKIGSEHVQNAIDTRVATTIQSYEKKSLREIHKQSEFSFAGVAPAESGRILLLFRANNLESSNQLLSTYKFLELEPNLSLVVPTPQIEKINLTLSPMGGDSSSIYSDGSTFYVLSGSYSHWLLRKTDLQTFKSTYIHIGLDAKSNLYRMTWGEPGYLGQTTGGFYGILTPWRASGGKLVKIGLDGSVSTLAEISPDIFPGISSGIGVSVSHLLTNELFANELFANELYVHKGYIFNSKGSARQVQVPAEGTEFSFFDWPNGDYLSIDRPLFNPKSLYWHTKDNVRQTEKETIALKNLTDYVQKGFGQTRLPYSAEAIPVQLPNMDIAFIIYEQKRNLRAVVLHPKDASVSGVSILE